MRSSVIWSISSILSIHSFITSLSKPENLCIIIIIKHFLLSLIRHNWAGNNTETIKPSDVYSAQGNRFFLWFPETFDRAGISCTLFFLQQVLLFIPHCPTFLSAFSSQWSETSSHDKEDKQLQRVTYFKGTSHTYQKSQRQCEECADCIQYFRHFLLQLHGQAAKPGGIIIDRRVYVCDIRNYTRNYKTSIQHYRRSMTSMNTVRKSEKPFAV